MLLGRCTDSIQEVNAPLSNSMREAADCGSKTVLCVKFGVASEGEFVNPRRMILLN